MMVSVMAPINIIRRSHMLVVKFNLYGKQSQETLDELSKSYVIVRDTFNGNNGVVVCYRICKDEEEA